MNVGKGTKHTWYNLRRIKSIREIFTNDCEIISCVHSTSCNLTVLTCIHTQNHLPNPNTHKLTVTVKLMVV